VLIAMVGFAVDVAHAYLVQRQLQSGVDAAALAGAQHLPEPGPTTVTAMEYGPSSGSKNALTTVDNAQTTVTMRCVANAPGCLTDYDSYNAVRVTATSDVGTYFARVLGIDSLRVRATATACSPCSAKDLDIMIVLDRTGSMCQVGNGRDDHPGCTDLANAKAGIKTFLGFMDPTIDRVGLAVFPPAIDRANLCATPQLSAKRFGYDTWWPEWEPGPDGQTPGIYAIASLTDDYLTSADDGSWSLNSASPLVQLLECTQTNGTTAYANAIAEAQHELETHGRGNVQDVIVFLSDGAGTATPRHVPDIVDTADDRQRPCGSGIKVAADVKARGTIIYTIGYDLNGLGTDWERCDNPVTGGDEGITAYEAMRQIASEPDNFYNKPDPGQLNTIFTRIAADLQRPSARLIHDFDGLQ
jgi:hypothetical protein